MSHSLIQCSAPGRAGLIGNPADMYGGSVVSCSTTERAVVTVRAADRLIFETGTERCVIASTADFTLVGDHFDIARAVVLGTSLTDLHAQIAWHTDIPFRAGLSGSTALLVALLNAVLAFQGIQNPRHYRAELARMIEYHHLGVFCGYQDAYMCTFGGLNYMDFRDKEFYRPFGTEPYATIEPLTLEVPMLPFVLAHTGVQRLSGAVHRPIRERWLDGDRQVVDAYLTLGRIARAGKKALLHGQWDELGRLMNENHAITRDLGGSGPENERLIQTALHHGALGAKLAGAGSGGTIIALHPEPDRMIAALQDAGATRILFPKPGPGVEVQEGNDE